MKAVDRWDTLFFGGGVRSPPPTRISNLSAFDPHQLREVFRGKGIILMNYIIVKVLPALMR